MSQDSTGNSGFSLEYSSSTNHWAFTRRAENSITATGISALSTGPVALNTWVHLVGVYDAAEGQLRLYVNGKPQGTATDTTPYASLGSLAIGRAQFGAQDNGQAWSLANVATCVTPVVITPGHQQDCCPKGRSGVAGIRMTAVAVVPGGAARPAGGGHSAGRCHVRCTCCRCRASVRRRAYRA